jgi:AraC family transcriptional regulator
MVTNNLVGLPRYGISPDSPSITPPEKWRYDACVKVAPEFVGAGKHLKTTIPGGKYATTTFKGTDAEIEAARESLVRDWLPDSGMQLDSRPIFEYYPADAKYDSDTGVFECDICIRVTAL